MAQYKVPQDVEADDKLLGPFTFRQFIYLLIAGGLIALAVGLFQIFPLLAIIPLPPVFLLLVLALPLKKDQPMETYLAALVSYYLKPRKRFWTPGQRETTVKITATKKVEENRTRDITGEEATNRLSFLADIVDTGGYAIKGAMSNPMREDLLAEANATADMFETYRFDNLDNVIKKDENERHEEIIKGMREAINEVENLNSEPQIQRGFPEQKVEPIKYEQEFKQETMQKPEYNSPTVVLPDPSLVEKNNDFDYVPEKKQETIKVKPSIIELANNPDFSVATLAEQAKRINKKKEGEVYISLH